HARVEGFQHLRLALARRHGSDSGVEGNAAYGSVCEQWRPSEISPLDEQPSQKVLQLLEAGLTGHVRGERQMLAPLQSITHEASQIRAGTDLDERADAPCVQVLHDLAEAHTAILLPRGEFADRNGIVREWLSRGAAVDGHIARTD